MAMPEAGSSHDWVESFKAWVWERWWRERMRVRGLSNATQ
jgi:hypothetical protein